MEISVGKKDVGKNGLLSEIQGKVRDRARVSARVPVKGVEDIIEARKKGRLLAYELGFTVSDSTLVATVISELARNIILYAKQGEITLSHIKREEQKGIGIIANDNGPGIENIHDALMSGYSSSGGLGLGFSGIRQIVDEFDIKSRPGEGTRVTTVIWL